MGRHNQAASLSGNESSLYVQAVLWLLFSDLNYLYEWILLYSLQNSNYIFSDYPGKWLKEWLFFIKSFFKLNVKYQTLVPIVL